MGLDEELERRTSEAAALEEQAKQTRRRMAQIASPTDDAKGYAKCAGRCGRVLPMSQLNTSVGGRPRGGGLAGSSHVRAVPMCGRCIAGV